MFKWFMILLPLLLQSSFASEKVDYKLIEAQDETEAMIYLDTHLKEKRQITVAFQKVSEIKRGLVKIQETKNPPVLIVHGIEKKDYYSEWVKPLGTLFDKNLSLYIFTWYERKTLETTQELLAQSMVKILKKFPHQNLTVLAHSAGGIIAAMALKTLGDTDLSSRIRLHTIATPLYGYGAPKLAYVAVPFVGTGPIELGRGYAKEFENVHLKNCHHWVTVTCEKDKHACATRGVFPQLGQLDPPTILPCGNDNITRLPYDGHASSIQKVVQKVFQ